MYFHENPKLEVIVKQYGIEPGPFTSSALPDSAAELVQTAEVTYSLTGLGPRDFVGSRGSKRRRSNLEQSIHTNLSGFITKKMNSQRLLKKIY